MPIDNLEQDKVRFNMWLKPSVYERFKEVATQQGRSMSDIARQLIFEFLDGQRRDKDERGV